MAPRRSSNRRLAAARRRRSARLAVPLGSVAAAPPPPAADRELRLTVYNDNLALVSDSRTLDVQAGPPDVELADVPAQIDPTSVHLKPLGAGGLEVLEQNFQYDLVVADRILQRYLDRDRDGGRQGRRDQVRARCCPSTARPGAATASPAWRSSTARRSRSSSCRRCPAGCITRPTLVWLLDTPAPAKRDAAALAT